MKLGVLYISYDGMLEPLGQSQVLAYQERLASNVNLHLLSFEKAEDWADAQARNAVLQRMQAAGIEWHPQRYHKQPSAPATAYDVMVGVIAGLMIILRYRIRIVHARSYVSAVMALILKKLTGARFVFDMRGFWVDERVDGGLWLRGGRMYRVGKWFERQFLLNADHVISLTNSAIRVMEKFSYLDKCMPAISVIPTCADLDRFKPIPGERINNFVLGYVGSAGTWYEFDAVAACFSLLLSLKPNAKFLIINRSDHSYIIERLKYVGVPLSAVELRSASHSEIPLQMSRMNAGIFFYKSSFSRAACAPTKLGEFLGCGLPCLSNKGVGDMAEILEKNNVGIALEDFKNETLQAGIKRLIILAESPNIENNCVLAAQRHFSLEDGVGLYKQVYRNFSNS